MTRGSTRLLERLKVRWLIRRVGTLCIRFKSLEEQLLLCEVALRRSSACTVASELEALVEHTFMAGRMDRALYLARPLSFLRFAAKLQTPTHLRILISF